VTPLLLAAFSLSIIATSLFVFVVASKATAVASAIAWAMFLGLSVHKKF